MRCEYCDKSVVGDSDVVIVVGCGPVHNHCYQHQQLNQRQFQGICMSELTLEELSDLIEMARVEINIRDGQVDNCVELFG